MSESVRPPARSSVRSGPLLRGRLGSLGAHAFLVTCAVALAGPFVWEGLTSFKTLAEAISVPPTLLPSSWHPENYAHVFDGVPFGSMLRNSLVSSIVRTLGQVLFCSMSGYAFARLRFPGRSALFAIFLSVLLVPSQLLIIPQFQMMQNLRLLDSIPALFLPGMFAAFGTFLLRQFFMSLPVELEEAARLDGASPWRIYWSIMLPLARPGLIALSILTFLWSWNDLLWPLIVNSDPSKMPLTVGVASLQGQYQTDYPVLMAAALLATLPVILVFVIMQRQVTEGIATAGLKG